MWHDELTEQLMRVRATFHKGGEYAYYDKITEGEKVWFYPDGHHVEQLEEYVLEPLENIRIIARYTSQNPFRSGRLIGGSILREKPVLIEARYGKGRIILFTFRPQNRAQTEGTFMLFFNSLYYR